MYEEIISFFKSIGFQAEETNSMILVNKTKKNIHLNLNFFKSENFITAQMAYLNMSQTLFDAYKINNINDLKFLILNNENIKRHFL